MECNKDEARRAMDTAEKKLSENDYVGAKKFVNKAQNLYSKLDGLEQVLMMIHVYISASKNGKGGEIDWYGVLGVDPLADDEALKKQYKKLALLLHPDKNKCKGAEGAFKLVSEALCLLSDKVKRIDYDQKRKSKTGMQKPPNPHKPASNNGNRNAKDGVDPNAKATSNKPKPPADSSQKHVGMFWTMCNECKTQCAFISDYHLNKVIRCPNCGQSFIAIEKTQWSSFVRPVRKFASSPQQQQRSAKNKARNKNKKGASGSWRNSSPSASGTQKTPQESAKSQATNNNTNGASSSPSVSATAKTQQASFVRPVSNFSSSPQQKQQQWSNQNQSTSQNTSGGTHSETTSTVSSSNSTHWHCSISVTTSSNGGNTANQAQERSKRVLEESQETTILKKPRTDLK